MRAYACSVLAVLFVIAACIDTKTQKTAIDEHAIPIAGADAGTTPAPDAGTTPAPDAGTTPDPGICETCTCGVALGDFEFVAAATYPYWVYVDVWKRKKNGGTWVYMTPSQVSVSGPTSGRGRPGIGLEAGLNYVIFGTGAGIRLVFRPFQG